MKTAYRRTLGVELLEQKQMLAGDVVVSMVHGALSIQGDAAANHVAVSSGTTEGSLVIQGLDGTTVHMAGSTTPAPDSGLVVQNVKGDVRVSLGDGDDVVDVHDATLRHDLTINTGGGADAVNVGVANGTAVTAGDATANVNVRGSVLIRTGTEGDTVNVASANIRGVLAIGADGGDDTVNLGSLSIATPGAALTSPDDASDTAMLHARAGIDVALGDGDDTANLNSVATRAQVVVGGGAGGDTINLTDVKTTVLGLRGGDGVDNVTLSGVKARLAAIDLGDGADTLSIVDSAFNSLAAGLGAGDDTLSLTAVQATRALLAGGNGVGDQFTDGGGNTLAHKVISGFELPADVNIGKLFPHVGGGQFGGGLLGGLIHRLHR
jgi:hypothetical protein